MDAKIKVTYKGLDLILHVDDYIFHKGGWDEGPDFYEAVAGWVELDMKDCPFKRFFDNQVWDSKIDVFTLLCNEYYNEVDSEISKELEATYDGGYDFYYDN